MKRSGKIATWLCIFSALLPGCSTSTMIYPAGKDKEKMYSNTVQYVITKDSKKYVFDGAPDIVKDSIDGKVNGTQISIPVSNVAIASVKEMDWTTTAVVGVTVGVVAVVVAYAVTVSSLHF